MFICTRRDLIRTVTAAGLISGAPRLAFAAGPTDKRLVVVLLRGAMDGLAAVPPTGDPDLAAARPGLLTQNPLALNSTFGMHSALAKLHARYRAGEVVVLHAAASPYRDRSHFDGQNVLETGATRPYGLPDGWLNRALLGLPDSLKARREALAVALASSTPLVARGRAPVTSWSPSVLPGPEADLITRVQHLYDAQDPALAKALRAAASANGMDAIAGGGPRAADLATLMTQAAKFLSAPDGPCAAVMDVGGWDTHANQPGVVQRNLAQLDRGLDALATGLGARWADTAVLVVTEFGRTVAANGTGGTDHGTAGAAFLLGGAVRGGRVLADWPGLKASALQDGRDLRPTLELDGVIKGVLAEHMGVPEAHLHRVVFPDLKTPVRTGLIRA